MVVSEQKVIVKTIKEASQVSDGMVIIQPITLCPIVMHTMISLSAGVKSHVALFYLTCGVSMCLDNYLTFLLHKFRLQGCLGFQLLKLVLEVCNLLIKLLYYKQMCVSKINESIILVTLSEYRKRK